MVLEIRGDVVHATWGESRTNEYLSPCLKTTQRSRRSPKTSSLTVNGRPGVLFCAVLGQLLCRDTEHAPLRPRHVRAASAEPDPVLEPVARLQHGPAVGRRPARLWYTERSGDGGGSGGNEERHFAIRAPSGRNLAPH